MHPSLESIEDQLKYVHNKAVGRVIATEKNPNTAQSFSFWTNLDSPVGIGTIVKVVADRQVVDKKGNKVDRIVYGIVTEGISYTDLAAPIHDFISSEGNPQYSDSAQTERPEIRYYTASTLKMIPEEPIQPVSIGNIYLADDADIKESLRMDGYADKTGIPVGLYTNGDNYSPVYLDSRFLLGPEAAHLNVTGVSGLATKTSIVQFLLTSIFQYHKDDKDDEGVAAVLFNVKGPDLLFLDQPAVELSQEELEMYRKLKLEPKPFENVEYYAPYKADKINLNTLRTNEEISYNVKPLSWNLTDIFDYVNVLMNKDDVDAKADGFLQFMKEKIINQDKLDSHYLLHKKIQNFNDLNEWFQRVLNDTEEGEGKSSWRGHAIPTIRKVHNRLTNITYRCEGLVGNDSDSSDLPWGEFKDRTIYVIDVAGVSPLGQDLVFTRAVEKLRELLEKKALGVKKVVVFVDELNKYASNDCGNSYLKQTLLEISERGRYLGLVLFSAQQFKSQVNKRIVGNCGTSVYGRMDMDELSTQGYSVMPSSIKAELTTLEKGKLLIRHPHFNQYIFVKFPRPPIMTSQDGIDKFPSVPERSFEDAMVYNLKRLDKNIKANDVKEAIYDVDQDIARKTLCKTELNAKNWGKQGALGYFKSKLTQKAPRSSFEDSYSPSPKKATIDDLLSDDDDD